MTTEFSWMNVALIAAFGYAAIMLAKWHMDATNPFDVRDYLIDQQTRKADLYKLAFLAMAVMSVWVIIKRTNADKEIDTLVLGVLGIFVVGNEAKRFISRPPEGGPPPGEGK